MQENSEGLDSGNKDCFEVFDELITDIKSRQGTPTLPTGLMALDRLIWGIHKKELIIIGARPSQGKTSLALQIAWNLAKIKFRVLFVSLEMSSHSVIERLLCNEFSIHGWKLRTGNTTEQKKVIDIQDKFRSRLLTYPFFVVDSKGKTQEELERLIQEYKPDAVFIDHLQRISSKGFRGKHEALSEYVQALKQFSMDHNVAIVSPSQINRQGSGVENAMDFMKGSGEIEEGADTLLQCNWVGRDDEKEPIEKYKVSVIKQRHGPIDSALLNFDVAHYRFTNWKEPINQIYS